MTLHNLSCTYLNILQFALLNLIKMVFEILVITDYYVFAISYYPLATIIIRHKQLNIFIF